MQITKDTSKELAETCRLVVISKINRILKTELKDTNRRKKKQNKNETVSLGADNSAKSHQKKITIL